MKDKDSLALLFPNKQLGKMVLQRIYGERRFFGDSSSLNFVGIC